MDGAFIGEERLHLWRTGDLQKRVSRSLFVDFALALLEAASPKLVLQIIQCR